MYFLVKNKIKLELQKFNLNKYIKALNSILFFLGFKFKYSLGIKFGVVLNSIFGIGYKKYVYFFCSLMGLSFNYSILFISIFFFQKLQLILRQLFVNYDLKKFINFCIYRQRKLKLYSGYRHSLFLSVRGQRTKTNSGSQKKKRFIK